MRTRILLIALVLIVAACGDGTTDTTTSTAPPSTSQAPGTTSPETTSTSPDTTTTPPQGLDLTASSWVLHDTSGISDEDGRLLTDTDAFLGERNLVRDHAGGVVFTDSAGLWWWQAGAVEPDLVLENAFFRLIEVIPTASGPVVRMAGNGDQYLDLATGRFGTAITGAVEVTADFRELWHAPNGLTATITEPELTLTIEGFPEGVIEPAHLVVTRDGETVLDLRIGGPIEAYARIHDFDGRHLIVSRLPYEPALPSETFIVIDLSCASCTESFVAGATTAALTGPQSEWTGSIATLDEVLCSAWDADYEPDDAPELPELIAATRTLLLRAAAACDQTAVQGVLADDPTIALSHAAIDNRDVGAWVEASPNLFRDVAAALTATSAVAVAGGTTVSVFPAWYAVDGWDDLDDDAQDAMLAWYGEDAASFWTDYQSIARDGDLSVTIAASGKLAGLMRPLS